MSPRIRRREGALPGSFRPRLGMALHVLVLGAGHGALPALSAVSPGCLSGTGQIRLAAMVETRLSIAPITAGGRGPLTTSENTTWRPLAVVT